MSRLLRFSFGAVVLVLFLCLTGGVQVNAAAVSASNPLIGQNSVNEACEGVSLGSSDTCPDTSSNLDSILSTVITILSIVVGVVAIIMIIVGGMQFITSGGESSKTAGARNTIIYALVGLVVAILAQVLVHFVLNRAANVNNAKPSTLSSS